MEQGLFRQEAIEHQGERLRGDFILSQPVSYSLITAFITSITVLAILFLWTNDYHRKQEVIGYLLPDKGMITVSAPRGGRLLDVGVELDQSVRQGSVLFDVQVEQTVSTEQFVSEQALQNLHKQEHKLLQRIELEKARFAILNNKNEDKKSNMQFEIDQLHSLLSNEKRLLDIKINALERARKLHEQGLLSSSDYDAVSSRFLEQENKVHNFEFRISQSKAELKNTLREKNVIALASRREVISLESELTELDAQKIRLDADNINKVLSPVDGKIASITISSGQILLPQQEVISLIPKGSILQAELFIPSRAIGFIKENQTVSIRYDAFPYQKYGVQKARISDISKTIIFPGETLRGDVVNEPVYRVIASLETQSVKAFGEEMPLRSGMRLSADVLIDERSLFEWVLEPLFSIKGRF